MSGIGVRLAKVLVLASLALTVSASAGVAAGPARSPLGVVPHAGSSVGVAPGATFSRAVDPLLPAVNPTGPVSLQVSPCTITASSFPCFTMRTNAVYAIYWLPNGYFFSLNYKSLIDRYFADVAAASGSLTNVYSVATQYYDEAAAIHYQSSFAGSFVDTDPFPANGCDDFYQDSHGTTFHDPVCLTDQQLQDELQAVMAAQGWRAGTTRMFVIMTPSGVGSCYDSKTPAQGGGCTTNAFCAYHNYFFTGADEPVLYANQPYDAAIPGCFSAKTNQGKPNNDDADVEINTISHEQIETITDPVGNAWLSADGSEIGDICAWQFDNPAAQSYNQVINGHQYDLQEEYANDGGCLLSYTPSVAPSTVAAPVVTGAAGEGLLLSTTEGSWMHAPSGYAYQWQRCAASGAGCADISGATAAAYRLTAADAGHTVRAEVRADNAAGTSAGPNASNATSPVVPVPSATTAPALSGIAAVGRSLSSTPGTWNSTVTVAYEWFRCAADGTGCTTIPGAKSAAYVPVAADAGHTLEASVAGTNIAGTVAALSDRSHVVVRAPASLETPHISGRARVGRHLTAARGAWSEAPKQYRFQWLRCNPHGRSCVRIRHATHSRYRLRKLDVRHRLRVRVTAVNAAGSRTATSRPTVRVPTPKP